MIELKDFVAKALTSIIEGVREAQTAAEDLGASINPTSDGSYGEDTWQKSSRRAIKSVEFDVAVTAEKGSRTRGGIGVFVGAIGLGSEGRSETSTTSVSRIRFSVPLVFPSSHRSPEKKATT